MAAAGLQGATYTSAASAPTSATTKPRIGSIYAGVGSSASSLVVGATVDTGGLPTTYLVEYGRGPQYGSATEPRPLPATSSGEGTTLEVRVMLTGLASGTRYHYRLVATNPSGSAASQNRTIVSGGEPPRISGAFVRPGSTPTSIVLGATVDTGGLVSAARAECGGGVRSADVILRATPSRGWAPTKREVRFSLANLVAGKHYACRLVAFNEAGSTAYQRDFETGKQPRGVQYPAVTGGLTPRSVVLSATIDTRGLPTTYHVEYGADQRYAARTRTRRLRAKPGKGWTPTTAGIRAQLAGLEPASTCRRDQPRRHVDLFGPHVHRPMTGRARRGRRARRARAAGRPHRIVVAAATCAAFTLGAATVGATATPAPKSVVIAAAGDIADDDFDAERTAQLLDRLRPALVLSLGDNAYESGTLDEYRRYFEPTWGRHKRRVRPVPGNHE